MHFKTLCRISSKAESTHPNVPSPPHIKILNCSTFRNIYNLKKRGNYWQILNSFYVTGFFLQTHENIRKPSAVLGVRKETNGLTITCPKSTLETLEKGAKYVQNYENTRTTSMTSFWCFYC